MVLIVNSKNIGLSKANTKPILTQRKIEEIKLQGDIKTEHIETASSDIDSDLTRIRKR